MKIAICMSGQIRTGVEASVNIKRFIGDLYPLCDFYIHTWDSNTFKEDLHKKIYSITEEHINNFLNIYQPKKFKVEKYEQFLNKKDEIMWYGIAESFSMLEDEKYTAIVRMRPDVIFPPSRRLSFEIINFMKNEQNFYFDIFTDSRIDDVFWVLNHSNSKKIISFCNEYSQTFTLRDFLKNNNIEYRSTYRTYMHYTPYRFSALEYNCLTEFRKCYETELRLYSGIEDAVLTERFTIGDLSEEYLYE